MQQLLPFKNFQQFCPIFIILKSWCDCDSHNDDIDDDDDDDGDDGDDDDDIDDIDDDVSSKGYGADWTEVATWSLPGIWADNTVRYYLAL